MYHFWSNFIEPIFNVVEPRVIVEIGAEDGHNTVNIVKYCMAHPGVRYHAIDPLEITRLKEVEKDFAKCATHHKKLSLEVLPRLEPADIYLIDGDHNWYSVFSELNQIYKNHRSAGVSLPIFLFHDINWPYARRDMYYDPSNIPEKYLQPYARKGVIPGKKTLVSWGINKHLNNALLEGGPKNGVLTAVEDFVKQCNEIFELHAIPGVHGLGVLLPNDCDTKKRETILRTLNSYSRLKKHLVALEEMRVHENKNNHYSIYRLNQFKAKYHKQKKFNQGMLLKLENDILEKEDLARTSQAEVARLHDYINRLRRFWPSRIGIGLFDSGRKIVHITRKARRFYRLGRSKFWSIVFYYAIGLAHQYSPSVSFDSYIRTHNLSRRDIKIIRKKIRDLSYKPLISIIVPTYNTSSIYLRKCIRSVLSQLYDNWELCIYDDASVKSETLRELLFWKDKDPRIKIRFGKKNMHISGASNTAIKMANGEFVGLLDHDDEITPDALYEVVSRLNKQPDLDFIYSDEDKLELNDKRSDHNFKPDFNLDYLLSICYIAHFAVIRKKLGDELNWFRRGYEGAQDHDLFIRLSEKTDRIAHIPKILYHWRKVPGSTAASNKQKKYCVESSTRALADYLTRNNIAGSVEVKQTGVATYRLKRTVSGEHLVSIIVPFKDKVEYLKTCVNSLIGKTQYENYELILVSNNSEKKETFDFLEEAVLKDKRVKWLEYNVPFNFSRINNWAVSKAKGEYVLFLNNDTEIINATWLGAMLEHIERPEVGAVGAKLLYPNKTVQHAGVILGIGGVAGHAHKGAGRQFAGYASRLQTVQAMSGVTGACLLTKKSVHGEIGGFNEKELAIAFNDVDYCLKIGQRGYKIIYTPFAELYHHESISRGYEDTKEKQERFAREIKYMQEHWGPQLARDPAYNPNLTLGAEDFSIIRPYELADRAKK